jgi:N utilization substance protein B
MATRHQARTAVVGLLYAYDLGNENIADFSEEILEEGKIRNKQREFSQGLFEGTIENLEMIDAEVEKHLTDWDYDGIGKVEKAIMRLGAYEILIAKTDKAIIINEAVELAKKLADEKSPQFINGVLDALGKPVKEKEKEIEKETEIEKEAEEEVVVDDNDD